MQVSDVAKLLLWVQGIDGRIVNELSARAWHELIGDLDVDDAKAAVEEHYRTESRYVTPADIRNRCGTEAYGSNETILMLAEQEAKWCAAAGVTVAQLHQARLMGDVDFIRRADARASKAVTRG